MAGDFLQHTVAGDVLGRFIDSVSSATRFDEIADALHAAVSAILPVDRLQLQFAGVPGYEFSSGSPRRSAGSPDSSQEPLSSSLMQRSESPRPFRTGELFTGGGLEGAAAANPAEMEASLSSGKAQLGSVTVQSFRVPAFSPGDESLLSLLADQAAPALERVTRLVRGPRGDSNIDLLESVQHAIAQSSSVASLLQVVAHTISETFDIGCGLVVSSRDELPILSVHHPVKEFAFATGSWLAEIVGNEELRHRLKTEVNPLSYDQAHPDPDGRAGNLLATAPVRAVHLFPLATTSRWAGALLLFDDTLLRLDVETHDAIKRVAHAIGLAVGEMLQPHETSAGDDQWRGWARVMTALLAGEPVATVLRDVLAISSEVVRADGAVVHIERLEFAVADHCVYMGTADFERLVRGLIQHGSIEGLFASDVEGLSRSIGPEQRESYASLFRHFHTPLVVPIQHGQTRLGHLALFRSNDPRFTTAEIADARQFASVMAATLHQRQMIELQTRQDQILSTVRGLAERLNRASTQQAMAEIAVEVCAAAFGSGKATLHVYQEQSERLVMAAAYGLPLPFVTANAHPSVGAGPCGTAAQRRSVVIIEDVKADPDWVSVWHVDEANLSFRSVWSVPLIAGDDHLLGTLTVFHTTIGRPIDDDVSFLQILGHQIASALDRARLADRSQDLYRATVESLAAAVDAKDPFTHNHSWQVAEYSRQIAEALQLSASETEIIELAGLLHDVGKIGIPDRVLKKPEALAPDEWAMMQRHPDLGARILGDNPALSPVVPLVRHHHERYDGHGYPDQLVGNDIPLGAAIVGLADAFDTMTSDRPYRQGRTLKQAVEEVQRARGTHFHPKVVDAFLDIVKTGAISPLTRSVQRSTTRELHLKRVVGAEARGFGLLQRISTEIGVIVDLDRFLHRLNELMSSEFPDSVCEIYGQDPNSGDLVAIANQRRQRPLVVPRGQGIVGWVAAHGMPQNVPDVLEDHRYMTMGHRLMRSVLAVPLVVDRHCEGVLSLEHPEAMAYSPSDQHVLEIVATYVAQAIQVANLHDRLKRNTNRDPLTDLPNHREFCQRLEEEIIRARMTAGILAIAIIDVHDLKSINQTLGHPAGDDVLKGIAETLKLKVRSGDTVARYGGDEFALLVPRVSGPIIRSRVSSISEALAERSFSHPSPRITFGIGSFPDDGTRATEIIAAAERALRDGSRNQRGVDSR